MDGACERAEAPMGFQSAVGVLRASAHARTSLKIVANGRYFRFSTFDSLILDAS